MCCISTVTVIRMFWLPQMRFSGMKINLKTKGILKYIPEIDKWEYKY